MTIELLPPPEKYPKAFHVRRNSCDCHPETCCCHPWAVHDRDGKKLTTHHDREEADEQVTLRKMAAKAPKTRKKS